MTLHESMGTYLSNLSTSKNKENNITMVVTCRHTYDESSFPPWTTWWNRDTNSFNIHISSSILLTIWCWMKWVLISIIKEKTYKVTNKILLIMTLRRYIFKYRYYLWMREWLRRFFSKASLYKIWIILWKMWMWEWLRRLSKVTIYRPWINLLNW